MARNPNPYYSLEPLAVCGEIEDCCTIFRGLIVVDSLGQRFINGLFGLGGAYYTTFGQGNLTPVTIDGVNHTVYPLVHSLGHYTGLVVRDNDGALIDMTDRTYAFDANTLYLFFDDSIPALQTYSAFIFY